MFQSVFEQAKKKSSKNNDNSLHVATRPFVFGSQLLGILPICGFTGPASNVTFKWCDIRVIYALTVICLIFAVAVMNAIIVVHHKPNVGNVSGLFYYANGFWILVNLFILAQHWPKLIKNWTDLETQLNAHYRPKNLNYTHSVRLMSISVVAAVLIDQSLAVYYNWTNWTIAPQDRNDSTVNIYLRYNYAPIFSIIRYSTWMGVAIKAADFICVTTSGVNDMIIMIFSFTITYQLKKLTDKVEFYSGVNQQGLPVHFWEVIRLHYTAICRQCYRINDYISTLILSSFMYNFFFICTLLFQVLQGESKTKGFYLLFSVVYTITRAITMILFTAQIHEESRKPIMWLFRIQSERFGKTVNVFIQQINAQPVCFSAKKFFEVKRSVVLSIIGIIITYELVLVQYRGRIS